MFGASRLGLPRLWVTSRPTGYQTMPGGFHDEESGESDSLLGRGRQKARRFWDGFVDFAFQDNILKIAFGLMQSFVSDVLMPPISVILPINRNIEEKFAVLKRGPNFNATTGYNTLHQAQEDGAVVMAYGLFIGQIISFIMLGLSLYGLAHLWQLASSEPIIKHTKKCKYCRQRINEKLAFLDPCRSIVLCVIRKFVMPASEWNHRPHTPIPIDLTRTTLTAASTPRRKKAPPSFHPLEGSRSYERKVLAALFSPSIRGLGIHQKHIRPCGPMARRLTTNQKILGSIPSMVNTFAIQGD
ncbi:hypothetical protein FZEAL_6979 [Fusarium zealandicum]|uniref:Large-conductance mechanosensitive channel n=1 Tax=Fusarium zealandicum TaxID=1053134 RepID=A0A8H4UGX5_9HYPO|nr:hypothetical protein FZEAL_6979 [Fusarium zealandicum]